MCTRSMLLKSCGFSLIEQIMVIVVVSIGIVGVMSALNVSIQHSADPVLRKQMIALAESLLLEVEQQPFTWCDPDDANAATALSAADCTNSQDKGGAALVSPTPASETRNGGAATQFDNVADYGGYAQANATDAAGGNVLTGVATQVDITRLASPSPAWPGVPVDSAAVLQIKVTVSKGGDSVSLTGVRFRYAPRY